MANIKTHEELLVAFLASVQELMKTVKEEQKLLKKQGKTDDQIKLLRTLRMIQRWFGNKGYLPI